jgi:G:T/U-mismatch repair DNA glycosylase
MNVTSQMEELAEEDSNIWIGTNPSKLKRASHRRLVRDYQICRNELAKRYTRS